MKNYDIDQMKPVLLRINELKSSKYQPATRTQSNVLNSLREAMATIPMVYPVVVDTEGQIVDGHRRVEVLREKGETMVPCIIIDTDHADLFAAINDSQRKLTIHEKQHMFLEAPEGLTKKQRNVFENLQRQLGNDLFEDIVRSHRSVASIANVGRSVINITGDMYSLRRIVRAILDHGLQDSIRATCRDKFITTDEKKDLILGRLSLPKHRYK